MILNFRASLLSEMIGAISASDADPQDVLYAVDADGEVVCWPEDNTQWSEAQLASIAAACRGKAQANGAFAQKEPGGETYIVTYAVSRTGDWLFVEMTHSRQVLHQLWFVFLEVAATAVVAMAAAVMASFWTARKLYRPIEKLNAHVRTQMPPASGTGKAVRTDELNRVSQAFDAMVHSTAELEQQTRHNELRMANVLLRRLLLGELSPANSDVQRLLEEKGISAADTAERNCALVLVKLSAYQNVEERYSEAERDACAYGVVNIGEELLGKRYTCAGAHMGKGQFCFLLQFDAQEAPNVLFDVRGIAESLQDALAQVYHFSALYAEPTILDESILRDIDNEYLVLSAHQKKNLIEALRQGKAEKAQQQYQEISDRAAGHSYQNMMDTYLYVAYMLYSECMTIEIEDNSFSEIMLPFIARLSQLESRQEVDRAFCSLLQQVADCFNNWNVHPTVDVVDQVHQYIQENYSDPNLSLNTVASSLKRSPSYVGRVYKELTDQSVAEYILGVRMEKIRTLLDTTRLSLGDILQQVGMERNNYFYTLFRKYFGVSFASYPRRGARSGGPDDKSAPKAD